MIGWERRVLLRHYVEQGMTKTELAERFGISRQTIHRWIREGELDRDLAADMVRYGPRSPVPTRLDPYKDIIVSRLGETAPGHQGQVPRLTAVRLFDEIKRAGYPGGYTQVKEYVREIRPRPPEEPVWWYAAGASAPRGTRRTASLPRSPAPGPPCGAVRDGAGSPGPGRFRRFPAALGQALCAARRSGLFPAHVGAVLPPQERGVQVQIGVRPLDRRTAQPFHGLVEPFCHTMRNVFDGLERAFAFFGGVPRELLLNQMKAVITKDE